MTDRTTLERFWKKLLVLTTSLLCCLEVCAIDVNMPSSGTNTLSLTPGTTYVVKDPGGASNYPNNCAGHLILTAPAGYLISMDGSVNLNSGSNSQSDSDSLAVYSSSTANAGSYLCGYKGKCTCLLTTVGNVAHFYFYSNNSGNASGFAITVRLVQPPSGTSAGGCVNYLDIDGTGANPSYGTFTNPSQYSGIAHGRHEIVYFDTVDPNTNNLLHRIPPGEQYSIRLGNDLAGGQAERISYNYLVDTAVAPLLILKYAAVLESPNHSAVRNPKFSFRLLDQNGQDINQTCYSATFVADASLGWNTCTPSGSSTSVCWKDWTTVGVDLSGVHGQTITIELTSYDCNPQQTGHYGYAYFTIGCAEKTIRSTTCGSFVRDTLTAPDGFTYQWHLSSNPSATLSTNQSYVVTTPGNYGCYLNFIGDPTHTCQFELTAEVNSVFPFARFSSDFDPTMTGAREVCFQNLSGIGSANDTNTIDPNRQYSSYWTFGDGSTSTAQSPCHTFQPGEYDVCLIINEVGHQCADTSCLHISISDIILVYDTQSICTGSSYTFFDTILTTQGTYQHESGNVRTILTLIILPTFNVAQDLDLVENQLPYSWNGIIIQNSIDTTVTLQSSNGCDSVVTLHAIVHFNVCDTADTIICSSQLPLVWNGTTFTQAGTQTVVLQGVYGQDSTVVMTVEVIESYSQRLAFSSCKSEPFQFDGVTYTHTGVYPVTYTAANGCDSVVVLDLVIEEPPAIIISADPPHATYEHLTISLKHLSSSASHWTWSYQGGVISTTSTANLQYPIEYDSIEVCLAASSASGCADTGCIVIPFYKGTAWVPNVFTPDQANNNTFSIRYDDLYQAHLWIYDRKGQLLYDFDALEGSWDGTFNGAKCQQGAYVWLLKYSTLAYPDRILIDRGTVLLLR